MTTVATIEWGARSRQLQSRLRQKVAGSSFWLTPATAPVSAGIVPPDRVADWAAAKTVPLQVTTDMRALSAAIEIPGGPAHVRLDFELVATVGGHSATVLSIQQLFGLAAGATAQAPGTLLPSQFAIADTILTPTPKGPTARKGPSPTGRKIQLGLHPLLSLGGYGKYSVNAEFVDVTELWWKVHPDATWGWYRHPMLKGRQEHLRVLAWTGGGNPMIWFAAAAGALVGQRAAAAGPGARAEEKSAADIVFYRPPPGSNAFPYAPTAAGFEAKQHDDTTMVNLARYLLAPAPEAQLPALQAAGIRTPELLTDRIQPKSVSPIRPANPMSLMKLFDAAKLTRAEAFTDGRANAFRPVGLENALEQTGGRHLLLLPLGFEASAGNTALGIPGNPQGGYEAVEKPGLDTTVQSALTLLWSINAVGRDDPSPPSRTTRQLWVAGHSEGNRSIWRTLAVNPTSIDRIISFDSDTLDEGADTMRKAGMARAQDRPLHAFVIVTPVGGDPRGLSVARDAQLRGLRDNHVLVSVLPEFDKREAYWHLTPPPIVNPYLLFLLNHWNTSSGPAGSKTLLELSTTPAGDWNFLFFHELAVFGGDLVQPSGTSTPRLRTFFEQALGPPNPRPPLPK
ncbi:hypothetical protein [Nocardia goodfellowii]|uniref:Uncharacterized protein n=1 Tax=Nocardia goodfellowii TaxID=882446 RepID=A0ABS4QIY0_9NOCA|nr:hypothetical protein [Nocardia goodfellowii]MBP2191620.1 hypothetical protein [Nocardia goodfellowii]